MPLCCFLWRASTAATTGVRVLAAFINNNGVYEAITDEAVGGKFYRSFTLVRIENGAVIGKTETCPDDGPHRACVKIRRSGSLNMFCTTTR